jgi:hypothetical protein
MINFLFNIQKFFKDDARVVEKCEKWPKNGPKTALFEGVADPKLLSVKMSADSPYT